MIEQTEDYVRGTCRIGQGADCCRYLTIGARGWDCENGTRLQATIDARVKAGTFTARAVNCDGVKR